MLNYQKLHYNEYRIMLPNGDSFETTRRECFAHAETPTEDNPYQQRWFYSPDCALAIRLPRNAMGEKMYHLNAATLKQEEREIASKTACVAQYKSVKCPVSCQNCRLCDSCTDFMNQATNGKKCSRKCECCAIKTQRNVELDAPIGIDDDGEELMPYVPTDTDIAKDFIRFEMQKELIATLEPVLASLGETDLAICKFKKLGLSNSGIGRELGITEGAIRKHIKKLERIFDSAGLKKFL